MLLVTDQEQLSQEIVDAKEKEIKNMIDNDVFQRVPFMAKQLFHVSGCSLKSL